MNSLLNSLLQVMQLKVLQYSVKQCPASCLHWACQERRHYCRRSTLHNNFLEFQVRFLLYHSIKEIKIKKYLITPFQKLVNKMTCFNFSLNLFNGWKYILTNVKICRMKNSANPIVCTTQYIGACHSTATYQLQTALGNSSSIGQK